MPSLHLGSRGWVGSRGTMHRSPGEGGGRHRGQREPAATSPAARPLTRDRSHDCPAPLTPSVHGSRSVHTPQSWSRREKTTSQRPHSVLHPRTNCLSASQRTDAGYRDPPASPGRRTAQRQDGEHERLSAARPGTIAGRAHEPASRARAPPQLPRKIRAPGAPWSYRDVKGRQKP